MIKMVIDAKAMEKAKRILEELGEDIKPALVDAANRAAKGGVFTEGKKALKEQYGVKQADVKEAFSLSPASRNQDEPTAMGIFRGSRLPVFSFAPKPFSVMGGKTEGGVSAMLEGQHRQFPHAFIAKMKSGHTGVFQREKGAGRLPIRELDTLSIPQMAEDKPHEGAISKKIQEEIQERFEERFLDNCERLLDKKFK